MDDPDRDDIAERLDRLEETLEELQMAIEAETGDAEPSAPQQAAETALRLTERLAVPAAVAALEANVRLLEFLQDRLEAVERREAPDPGRTVTAVSEPMLDRLDDALARMERVIEESDLPQNAEARELLERARGLNQEVRERAQGMGTTPEGDEVVTIDVEEELDQLKDDVEDDE